MSETHQHSSSCCHGDHDHQHHHDEPSFFKVDSCEGVDHGHSHAQLSLGMTLLGGVMILSSYLADLIFSSPSGHSLQGTILALAASFLLGLPILITAFKDILNGRFFMNELVALALMAAFADGDFRTAAAVAFFMLIAVMIEHRTAVGARHSIEELIKMTPNKARRLKDNGEADELDVDQLSIGDRIEVRPGEAFPVDGEIIAGITTVNQASITGESLPVGKEVKDDVYAGTENLNGRVELKVTRLGEDTTLGQVRGLIEQAEQSRLPIMRMIDRYAVYYLPTVLMLAALVYYFTGFQLDRVIAILVIACPCALVVATPSAIVASLASAARLGLLVKDVTQLETLAKVGAFVFDKTGTLTEGHLKVSRMQSAEGVEASDLLEAAVIAESQSNHPVAQAIVRLAEEVSLEWPKAEQVEEVPGQGVLVKVDQRNIRVGRQSWLEKEGLKIADSLVEEMEAGKSIVFVAEGGKVLGWIALSDAIRPQSAAMIQDFEQLGISNLNMVTGDNDSVAQTVAKELNMPSVQSACLPQDKVDYVHRLKEQGYTVAVVGDGVNDAPALASGDIGIAIGTIGSDVAVNSASVALMNNDLRRIPFLLRLARKTQTVMNQNLFIGFVAIIGGIFFSSIGQFTGITAAILHSVSTLIIIMNSARLVREGEELEENKDD